MQIEINCTEVIWNGSKLWIYNIFISSDGWKLLCLLILFFVYVYIKSCSYLHWKLIQSSPSIRINSVLKLLWPYFMGYGQLFFAGKGRRNSKHFVINCTNLKCGKLFCENNSGDCSLDTAEMYYILSSIPLKWKYAKFHTPTFWEYWK